MDDIRKILFAVRDSDTIVTGVEGVPDDSFKFNAMLLIEAGLVLGNTVMSSRSHSVVPQTTTLYRLTWKGFDFMDSIKDDALWEKTKKHILKPTGSWTFGILKEFLKMEIKQGLGINSGS